MKASILIDGPKYGKFILVINGLSSTPIEISPLPTSWEQVENALSDISFELARCRRNSLDSQVEILEYAHKLMYPAPTPADKLEEIKEVKEVEEVRADEDSKSQSSESKEDKKSVESELSKNSEALKSDNAEINT